MAGINIKNIPNATSLSTEDFVIVEQEAGTKKTSIKDLTKTGTVVHYSENPDNIVLQRPDMIEKINNMESNITSVTSQLEQNQKKIVNILTPELFGAVGDGVADDTIAIQNMFNSAKCGQKIEFKSNTKYRITNTIEVPRFLEVDGCNCFIMLGNGLISKFAFKYGVENNNHIIDTFSMQNEFKNFNIQHYGEVDGEYYNGIYVTYDCVIKNIYTWGLNKTIEVESEYIDMVIIDGVNIWGQWGDDYMIITGFTGDCREVKNVHVHYTTKSQKVLKIGNGHNTCRIKGIINGGIEIGSSMVELSDLHIEFGNIKINEKANVKISNLFMFAPTDTESVVIGSGANVIMENCQFNYYKLRDYSINYYHPIRFVNKTNTNLIIKNCFKNLMPNNDITFRATSGVTIKDFDDFNYNSLNNSINSVVKHGRLATFINPMTRTDFAYDCLGSVYKDGNFTWKKATGTYYYKAILIYDEQRKIAELYKTNEVSVSLTLNGNCPMISLNGGINCDIKLYRGTKPGVYDSYVILGANTNILYDDGVLVNGAKWETMTESGIETYFEGSSYLKLGNNRVTVMNDKIPTVGIWSKGDRVINSLIQTGNTKAWIYNGSSWVSEGIY